MTQFRQHQTVHAWNSKTFFLKLSLAVEPTMILPNESIHSQVQVLYLGIEILVSQIPCNDKTVNVHQLQLGFPGQQNVFKK